MNNPIMALAQMAMNRISSDCSERQREFPRSVRSSDPAGDRPAEGPARRQGSPDQSAEPGYFPA